MNRTRGYPGATTSPGPLAMPMSFMSGEPRLHSAPDLPARGFKIAQTSKFHDGSPEADNLAWLFMTQDRKHSLNGLAASFRFAIMRRSWLNAYLLAAGMDQVVEDYLYSAYPQLQKTARIVENIPVPAGALLAKTSTVFTKARALLIEKDRSLRKVIAWQQKLLCLIDQLAEQVIDPEPPNPVASDQLVADGGTLMAYVPYFPADLGERILQLPACFRDQHDLGQVVARFLGYAPVADPARSEEDSPFSPAFIQEIFTSRRVGGFGFLWQAFKHFSLHGGHFHGSPQ